nr:uncharacterized protein LOC128697919 [Cherax quadricarinatus]
MAETQVQQMGVGDPTGAIQQCILSLHNIGVVKFGRFTLKSGMQSPVYFDLRLIVSYPKLMETVSELMWAARPGTDYDLVCGVAYTGLPIATVISTKQNVPMLIRRKETKGYGTKKLVEGSYQGNQKCLMIEDVIVSGSSVYESVETLRDLKLDVKDAVVFLDREQGGTANLKAMDINIVSVVTMTEMMSILLKHGCIDQVTHDSVLEFVSSHRDTSIVTKEKTSCKNGIQVMDPKTVQMNHHALLHKSSSELVSYCSKMAENHTYFVVGFVSQSSKSGDPRFILFTPGVRLGKTGDGLGQQYVTPRSAILERGADIIIVGRGITQASDPVAAAKEYQEEAFDAYQERIKHSTH